MHNVPVGAARSIVCATTKHTTPAGFGRPAIAQRAETRPVLKKTAHSTINTEMSLARLSTFWETLPRKNSRAPVSPRLPIIMVV